MARWIYLKFGQLAMLLVQILNLLASVVLCFQGGAIAVNYYVTPSEPPNPACPAGETCETLDHYARNISKYFDGKDNVTMVFLGGIHKSTQCFSISCPPHNQACLNLMVVRESGTDEEVNIELGCDFKLAFVKVLEMSDITIQGMQRFGLNLQEAPVIAMTLNRVTFVGAGLWFGGHLLSTITISNCRIEASLIEAQFVFSDVNVFILHSNFTTGLDQNRIISMCIGRGSVNLFIDSILTSSSSDIDISAPQLLYCGSDQSPGTSTDIMMDFSTGKLVTTIVNSVFSRGYGRALYYYLGTSVTGTEMSAMIENCLFQHHSHGAIVLSFSTTISLNVTIKDTTFVNNMYTGTDGGSSGVQIIYPVHGAVPIWIYTYVITFQNCIFRNNRDQVLLLYKSINVTFKDCMFVENTGTSIVAFHTTRLVFSGKMDFIKNSAYRGAGLVLTESTLYLDYNTFVTFYGNRASNKGGAILVEGNKITSGDDPTTNDHCFYQIWWRDGAQFINFTDNYAVSGGHDIYGSPLASYCLVYDQADHKSRSNEELGLFWFQHRSLSSISSDPRRVCLCDISVVALRCDDADSIFVEGFKLYPGEKFSLYLAVVGVEFGTVTATVQASLTQSNGYVSPDYHLVTETNKCTELSFSVHHSSPSRVRMYLTTEDRYAPYYNREVIQQAIQTYHSTNVIPTELLNVPVIIDISLLPCPPGFVLVGDPPICDCYPQIVDYITCEIDNGSSYVSRKDKVWIGINSDNNTIFSTSCVFEHCTYSSFVVDLADPNTQCAFHHAGQLCGGCADEYSLAIGTTHCIRCQDNRYLSLLILFVAAGFMLVFFIHVLNLTVTQGTINGIVLYVNIVWTYQEVLFPQLSVLILPLKLFLAWFNLDFGVESCFAKGLNAFWKTWLQFLFPLYVWSIAGTIVVACKHSIKLTNMFGERAVPTLATLFLMSYLKLLRTTLEIFVYTTLTVYPSESKFVVWSLDGNLLYGGYPHIFLLLVAMAVLLLVYVPYTMIIFSIQWLRKISHLRLFRWVVKFNPTYDAHLAPLKDRHHYWFGTLLILRGILLVVFTLTAMDYPSINLLLLLISVTTLLAYMLYFQLYKSRVIQLLQAISFLNLILLAGGSLYVAAKSGSKTVLINISVAVSMIQFFMVILQHTVKLVKECYIKKQTRGYANLESIQCSTKQYDVDENTQFRDSILN